MSETSNVTSRQVDAELERYFQSLRAFRTGPEPAAPPASDPRVRWTVRDVRLFVATFAMMAVALGLGLLLGMI